MFRKYKYVLAVYEEKNFTKAANKLFISQPSLSVAIQNIEKEIGSPLFERINSQIKPTAVCEAYVSSARKMLQAENDFERQLNDINGLQCGSLSVGGTNLMSTALLHKIITKFQTSFPKIDLNFYEANSIRLGEMLNNETVDIVIDNFGDATDLYETIPLSIEHILLCVPENRDVNKTLKEFQITPNQIYNSKIDFDTIPSVDVSLFKDEDFVLLKTGNDMHKRSMEIFAQENIPPRVILSVDQLNVAYSLTESGIGSCFVTDTLFKYRRHFGNVFLYKISHPLATRQLHIAYKKHRYCTKAMSEFIKLAKQSITN